LPNRAHSAKGPKTTALKAALMWMAMMGVSCMIRRKNDEWCNYAISIVRVQAKCDEMQKRVCEMRLNVPQSNG
jgi:hypothetical protein